MPAMFQYVSTFCSFKIPLSKLDDMSLQRPDVYRLSSLTDAVVEVMISGFPFGYSSPVK